MDMKTSKVAISIDSALLKRVDGLVRSRAFASRSQAFQKAVEEKLSKLRRSRLAQECEKLNKKEEKAFAEMGVSEDLKEWPDY